MSALHQAGSCGPSRVADAVRSVEAAMDALDRVRSGTAAANTHGGDPGLHRNRTSLLRHCVNYLVAAAATGDVEAPGPVVDVGAGTGSFSGLLRERLGRPLTLVDPDEQHAALAAAAFPDVVVRADLAAAPAAAVVAAMEVVEHLRPAEQQGFVAALAERVRPGGALVLSTPDESGYLGGWSGYAPHVGPLDAAALLRVVVAGTGGWPVRVLRIDGPAFRLTRLGAVLQPVGNRAWTAASRLVGGLEPLAVRAVHRITRDRPAAAVPPDGAWSVADVLAQPAAPGTGLLAVARRPA
ncbi:methyltransferase domain-containing protein [Quadrisphaera sp. DSM 44207]|uniref:methyltransferase domain-containing protein n=1 Tax=Quadrisphaera sp. DSM 44207 TaxID=1881057 RepID=UPI00087E23E9|nr:methyltransferase domain-containing protein [Quadrisphaera sp. DSM 44207]SDQ19257.1 Methyltransferase domain-containing protein [Quadrisphaera sp. DSM 44207]